MLFLRILEILFMGLGLVLFATQILWPLLTNRPLFPYFRKKKLVTEYAEELEKKDNRELQQKIDDLRQEDQKSQEAK